MIKKQDSGPILLVAQHHPTYCIFFPPMLINPASSRISLEVGHLIRYSPHFSRLRLPNLASRLARILFFTNKAPHLHTSAFLQTYYYRHRVFITVSCD